MVILGVNAYHGDVSAVLLRDGALVAAVEEERFWRVKHWAGFPREAIRACLEMGVSGPRTWSISPSLATLARTGYGRSCSRRAADRASGWFGIGRETGGGSETWRRCSRRHADPGVPLRGGLHGGDRAGDRENLFVMSSLQEGTPIAILEAMAMERPVVGTQIAGIPEQVVDGKTGLLLPPGDAGLLGDAILQLLRDPVARAEMGQNARKRVELEFSLDRCLADHLRLYQALSEAVF